MIRTMRRRGNSVFKWVPRRVGRTYKLTPAGTLLMRTPKGAMLMWVLDVDPVSGEETTLVVHLTDAEAKAVLEADWRTGLLEPVRSGLAERLGLVMAPAGSTAFYVDGDVDEEAFVEAIFAAAEDPAAHLEDMYRRAKAGDRRLADMNRGNLDDVTKDIQRFSSLAHA